MSLRSQRSTAAAAENAARLAAGLPHPPAIYTEIDALLQRADIEAVDIVLPIPLQPTVVEAALKAGKHVLSEKPVAPDVSTGQQLLETADRLTRDHGLVWMVAENFRYMEAFAAASRILRSGEIGHPLQFSWVIASALNPDNQYYQTAWRRDNSFPGGFILDGGVHQMAAMRAIMGEVESVAAFTTQVRPDLPPADTLSATLRFQSGAFGIFSITFAAGVAGDSQIQVVGDRGALKVSFDRVELTTRDQTRSLTFAGDAVQAELSDFGRAVQRGGETSSPPREALRDVAVLEAMFESSRTGQTVQPQHIV